MKPTDDSQSPSYALSMGPEVECYSGHTYAQEPRCLVFGNERLEITEVRRRWRKPTGPCFEVLTGDGARYILAYDEAGDFWSALAQELTLGGDVHEAKGKSNNREDVQR